jgi:hypothetical protein
MGDLQLRLNQIIGGLTVLSAAALSTGILSHTNSNPSRSLTIAAGVLAFFAAVLAGLQSFYKFGEVAEKHRTAGANYGDVRMKLELFLIEYESEGRASVSQALAALEAIQTEISNLDKTGPGFPSHRYKRVEKQQQRLSREGSASSRHNPDRDPDGLSVDRLLSHPTGIPEGTEVSERPFAPVTPTDAAAANPAETPRPTAKAPVAKAPQEPTTS